MNPEKNKNVLVDSAEGRESALIGIKTRAEGITGMAEAGAFFLDDIEAEGNFMIIRENADRIISMCNTHIGIIRRKHIVERLEDAAYD